MHGIIIIIIIIIINVIKKNIVWHIEEKTNRATFNHTVLLETT